MNETPRKNVFVSSDCVPDKLEQSLITDLRSRQFIVEHSPLAPQYGEDSRRKNWYSRGLPEAVKRADAFIIVIGGFWTTSTWMLEEAEAARKQEALAMYFWNPLHLEIDEQWKDAYLHTQLPDDLAELAKVLLEPSL